MNLINNRQKNLCKYYTNKLFISKFLDILKDDYLKPLKN